MGDLSVEGANIIVKNVNKNFKTKNKEVNALQNVNLHIQKGEIISIIGSSGCGKSTLLRIIAGLDVEYDGDVQLNGQRIVGPGIDRGIVFQEHRLFPWLTVEENIAFGLQSVPVADAKQTIKEHIELVGLQGFEKSYPHQLSGGMAQRASIARALVNRPQVLILDEPFGALDALTKMQMQQEVLRIWEVEKMTMILVTHDIDEAVFLGDRVIVMSGGPGRIKKNIPVELPRPRDRNSYEFSQFRKIVYQEFFAEQQQQPFAYVI
ncbi:ABC transporter ATP-binding protein [Pelosinus sp. sgz500959]|uniref:ABC transporter ATP-binding protein n=1 Tax=Pelosinus sp. sgz500959 TaxID=3242472 RepID=UPI003671C491